MTCPLPTLLCPLLLLLDAVCVSVAWDVVRKDNEE